MQNSLRGHLDAIRRGKSIRCQGVGFCYHQGL